MEEKRLLLAVVLSLAVLITWQMVFKPPPRPKGPPVKSSEPSAPTDVKEPVPPAGPRRQTNRPDQPPEPVSTPPAESPDELVVGQLALEGQNKPADVTVETDLYRCVISTAGGHIKSFELKKFRENVDENSPPKQLISSGLQKGRKPLSMNLYIGGRQLPPDAVYSTDAENIDLQGKPPGAAETLVLKLRAADGYDIERRYTFNPVDYQVALDIAVMSEKAVTSEENLKKEISERASINWYTHVNPGKKSSRFATFAAVAFTGVDYNADKPFANASFKKNTPGALKKKGPFKYDNAAWMGFSDSYFLNAVILKKGTAKITVDLEGQEDKQTIAQRLEFPPAYLKPGGAISHKAVAYLGPKDFDRLRAIGLGLDRSVGYGKLEIFIRPLIYLLKLFNRLVHNWGLSIILLTVFIKLVFYPLTFKSQQAMKKMQALQPRIKELQAKYKGDKEKVNQEMMALYRTHKVNPLGGCLPMVLQLPVLYGLYRCLYVSIDLRHAHFIGWITDLSSPESLFVLPVLNGVHVGLMPLLMGGSMYIQQKMTPTTMDPSQAKMFMMMPLIFTFISFGFPSGLVLYWSVSNLLTIAQQYVINRRGT